MKTTDQVIPMQKLTIHPELKALRFPPTRTETKILEELILKYGCCLPILVWKDISTV